MFPKAPHFPRKPICIAICLSTLGAGSLVASPVTEPTKDVLDRLVARNKGHGGGAVRITGPNGIIWEGAAGNTAGLQSPPMTPDTPFEIASITKSVTAATVLRLVEEGKLRLDTTLAEALPAAETKGFDNNITLEQLLSHTSGLQDYWTDGPHDHSGNNAFLRLFLAEPQKLWKPDEMLDFARELPAKRRGGHFHYSDTNYVLLGRIIERTTGQTLHDVFREMIFKPLGMHETWLSYHEKQRGVAPSHRFEGAEDLNAVPRQSADWAGGGLVSTTRDLDLFLRGLASGTLFRNPKTLDTMREAVPVGEQDISYGLGLYRVKLDNGLGELWGHDGHGNSFAYYWPQRGITFTGTLNQTENDWWPLVQTFIEDGVHGIEIARPDNKIDVSLSTGWDSLYMYRGQNSLRDDGKGYGSGIYWTDLNVTWSITDSDFLNVDIWQCFATQGSAYKELDNTLSYTHLMGSWELGLEYAFDYGFGAGNLYSNELGASAAWEVKIGPATLIPSAHYYFDFGPDADAGTGFVKSGSSFLVMRLDGSLPVFRDIVALQPWTAFSVNFQYNTKDGQDGEPVPFNGPNNVECGLSIPVRINRTVTVSGYGAYSYALANITNTAPSTFWGGVSVVFSF